MKWKMEHLRGILVDNILIAPVTSYVIQIHSESISAKVDVVLRKMNCSWANLLFSVIPIQVAGTVNFTDTVIFFISLNRYVNQFISSSCQLDHTLQTLI